MIRRGLVVLLTAVLVAVGLTAVAAPAVAGPAGTTHPTPSSGVAGVAHLCGPTNTYDCTTGGYSGSEPWGYYTSYGSIDGAGRRHNCTTYAAFKVAANGVAKPGWYDDANGWDTKAWAAGTPVDQSAAVGAVAQWNGGQAGHVAYVEAVGPDYIEVTDDNYGWNTTNRWRISTSSAAWPDNFIHFHDAPVNPPPPTDRDGDGTPDSADQCPDQAGPVATGGCPDQDGDAIRDSDDACKALAGPATLSGCPEEIATGGNASSASFNGDGRADFCRVVGGEDNVSSYAQCTVSAGSAFGATTQSGLLDYGYTIGRAWVDFNGDGRTDFCRRTGGQNNVSSYVQCTMSRRTGFAETVQSSMLDWGFDAGRAWVDVNGDGRADFCRVVGGQDNVSSYVTCTLSKGSGFGREIRSPVLDWGYDLGRAWVDFNGDGRADFCRLTGGQNLVSSYLQCTMSTGTGFGATVQSGLLDWGFDAGRAWVDANGDGRADFCRAVGGQDNVSSYLQCTMSTGTGFGATVQSGLLDWGYDTGRAWVDVNGDGRADYCRRTGGQNGTSSYVQCTMSTKSGFGATVQSPLLDWGYDAGRSWADFDGDGRADFCRVVGGEDNVSSYVQCTLAKAGGFGRTVQSPLLDWGYTFGRSWA